MNNKKKSSIIDVPREAGQDDLLGLDNHARALVKFVQSAGTPLTIAIQGEWGSGKTSMMNQIKDVLCDGEGAPFYGIWLNTWQYALLSDEELILSKIVSGLTNETIAAIQKVYPEKFNSNIEKVKDVTRAVFKGALKLGVKQVAGNVGVGVVDEVLGGEKPSLTVNDLRNKLCDLLSESVAEDTAKDGFLFFVDDLDRIEPIYAVQILELLKNIFNIPKCLFILAIDYDVVVKGLEPKFGPLTEKNEREFRSFFDKIIQLPFSMPVSRYEIDDFIIQILDDVDYLTEHEEADEDFKSVLSLLAENSVGRNPRALKRLTNSLSLIKIFNELDKDKNEKNDQTYEKLMNIGLICCQIAYPFIYRLLNSESDYKKWNEGTATRLRLKALTEGEKERLSEAEEFDEEWEQIVYRACQRDPYLAKNAIRVSRLLNLIADQLPEDKDLGTAISSLLSLSSVTSVETQDAGSLTQVTSRSKFSGIDEYLNKFDPGNQNPTLTSLVKMIYDDINQTFPESKLSLQNGYFAFSNPAFPRRKKNFIRIHTGLNIKTNKDHSIAVSGLDIESLDEEIPSCLSIGSYKKLRFLVATIKAPEDYNQEIKDAIRRGYNLGMKGIPPITVD